ncbi:MAG: hypothetical protein JSV42_07620 [Chloroflexota bacterium]|nr:MAG: hypothetical protein JSV42_07620 [Chloroflexota bacterium]
MAVLIIAPIIYGIIALNTGDLLWVSPVFNYQPQRITVHCFGEDVYLERGTEDFQALTDLVNQSLTGRKRWDSVTLSDATYQEYQSHPQMMVVELFYSEPVRVHSRYKFFSNVDRIIIPLVGRHANTNAVFGRRMDFPAAGSFHVRETAPVKNYLAEKGLCREP